MAPSYSSTYPITGPITYGVSPAVLGGVRGSSAPNAPLLSLISELAGVVKVNWDNIDDTIVAGDTLRRQVQVSGGSWTVIFSDVNHTITSPEDAANEVAGDTLTLGNGTWDIRGFVIRASDGKSSVASNTLTLTISDAIVAGKYVYPYLGV